MPPKLDSKADRALAELIDARYLDAAEMRYPRVEVWDDAYDRHNPAWISDKVRHPPKVKFPYLHNVTERQVTLMLEAMDAAPRWLEVRPITRGFEQHAETVATWLDLQMRRKGPDYFSNNRDQIKRLARFGVKYGNGWVGVGWDARHGGIRLTNIDPYDVYPDARHGNWIITRRFLTLAGLQKMAEGISAPRFMEIDRGDGSTELVPVPDRDEGRAMTAFRKVLSEVRNGKGHFYVYNDRWPGHGNSRRFSRNRVQGDGSMLGGEGVNPEDDPFNAVIMLLEYFETQEDGIVATVIPSFNGGESILLRKEYNPYRCAPIVPFVPHPVDNELFGLGNGEIVGKLSEALDYNLRASLSMVGAAGWPPLLYTRNAQLRRQYMKSLYGLAVEVRDINADMGYMQSQVSPALHQIAASITQQAMDFGLGESDLRRGNVGQARNATAAAIAETFGNITDKTLLGQWHDANEQLGYVMLNIARVHMNRSQIVPMAGRNAGHFLELRPEILRDAQWAVTFGGSARGANVTAQITAHLNIAQAFAASGEIDIHAAAREVYRLIGERNPDRFLTRKDPVPSVPPAQEEDDLFRLGQHPEVGTGDNHQEHIQSHAVRLQQAQQELGVMHPHVKALLLHLQMHSIAFQSQAGGAAGRGTPGMFGPAQAGTAGNPQSAQPRFEGLNEQRQRSNTTAAGGAPGPTGSVPGRQIGEVASGGGVR